MSKKGMGLVAQNAQEEKKSIENIILQAVQSNVSVETMEKIFSLRERVKAEQAKEAFVAAMAEFQEACPIIKKTKKVLNRDGQTVRYMYAPIDSIVEQIRKPLSKSGLSYTWSVKNEPGLIAATATVTHSLGHSESSSFQVPIDTEGFMTAPQKYASALTFAKRYSLCNVLGISTGDEDTDAVDVGKEAAAKSTKAKIIFLLRSLGQKTATKEQVESSVKSLVKLDLDQKNYPEIISRLQVLVSEKNEDSEVR